MGRELSDALDGGEWALSGLLYALDDVLDDEGRPLAERRAPSAVKRGVAIELRPCPYRDERHGYPMNASALAQVVRHFDEACEDIFAFRRLAKRPEPTWFDAFSSILDQLAGPAVLALRQRDPRPVVPAARAVGHKLAAGYFGVIRGILRRCAIGQPLRASVDGLMKVIHGSGALLGASEACAGPPRLIGRISRVILGPVLPGPVLRDEPRLEIARGLSIQIALGVAWELFDRTIECELLLHRDPSSPRLRPRNVFLERRLRDRIDELLGAGEETRVAWAVEALPRSIGEPSLRRLQARMEHAAKGSIDDEASRALERLIGLDEVAIGCPRQSDRTGLARSLRDYVAVYREFLTELWQIEMALRRALGLPIGGAMKLNGWILPRPRALAWFEAILGHRIIVEPWAGDRIVVKNEKRSADLTDLYGSRRSP